MSAALLQERRHRSNQAASQRHRMGFPKLGFSDTWMIDQVQILVEENHGVLLFPDWSNSYDYADTPERQGCVPIHSPELTDAINNISVDLTKVKLSSELQYLAEQSNLKLPLLPVHGKPAYELFTTLLLKYPNFTDTDSQMMAIDWCDKVDGVDIFPTLPAYLRKHHTKWLRGRAAAVSWGRCHATTIRHPPPFNLPAPITLQPTRTLHHIATLGCGQGCSGWQCRNRTHQQPDTARAHA